MRVQSRHREGLYGIERSLDNGGGGPACQGKARACKHNASARARPAVPTYSPAGLDLPMQHASKAPGRRPRHPLERQLLCKPLRCCPARACLLHSLVCSAAAGKLPVAVQLSAVLRQEAAEQLLRLGLVVRQLAGEHHAAHVPRQP
jgi:hypothetical protein